MRPISENRLRAMAKRCETAKHKRCKCRCGGEQHGIAHKESWISEEVLRDRLRFLRPPGQIDWIGFAGFEQYLTP